MTEMRPTLANLIYELNGFGEDGDTALVASMYRHLAHWPAYLALDDACAASGVWGVAGTPGRHSSAWE